MTAPRIRTFSHHYREIYGEPVGKIPIDTGVVCPNRKYGGCIFCRPASFTPEYLDSKDSIKIQVARGKTAILKGRFSKYLAYYQQETCTALPANQLLEQAATLLADPDCVGLILSTRPDQVPDMLLPPLAELVMQNGKECLFELGLQTVHERSLQLLNRNHSFHDFTDSVARIQEAGPFSVGAHLIFGIPGENEEDMLTSLATVCDQGIDSLKLHHLQVIRDTELHRMYSWGKVQPFTLGRYLEFLLRALPLIPERVTIHRLWATSHPNLLVAPKWNILATHLSRQLQESMAKQKIWQGCKLKSPIADPD